MSKKCFVSMLFMAYLAAVIMISIPAGAQTDIEKETPDFSGVAKCCGIAFEQEDGTGTAKCCGCTIAQWNVYDAALVVTAMMGLVVISKRQK